MECHAAKLSPRQPLGLASPESKPMKSLYKIEFEGMTCRVFPYGICQMGGWTFQIEAACPALRKAIEAAAWAYVKSLEG